jgi:hypothetical protein
MPHFEKEDSQMNNPELKTVSSWNAVIIFATALSKATAFSL